MDAKIPPQGVSIASDFTFLGGNDGKTPSSALVRDGAGNLYGVTQYGGTADDGTVFKVAPDGTETVLHSFNGNDGAAPGSALFRTKNGNLYGTTFGGGAPGLGVVFKLAPDGTETVLHIFSGSTDGCSPSAGLIRNKAAGGRSYFYGTTSNGIGFCSKNGNQGTIFKIKE
ncbi:MAG: choice-of-anchor tandem repeat GloVer-containing protein [Rhizomicrobium sp.]